MESKMDASARHSRVSQANKAPSGLPRIARNLSGVLAAALFALFCLNAVSQASGGNGALLGFRSFIVLTGSMSPAIDAGSYIVVKETAPEQIQAGDIITYKVDSGAVLTHRVVEIAQSEEGFIFRTKGDANNMPDIKPVTQEQLFGVTMFRVKGLGAFLLRLQSPRILIIVVALLCAVTLVPKKTG